MKVKSVYRSILVIMVFFVAVFGSRLLDLVIEFSIPDYTYRVIYAYSWWLVPVLVATVLLYGSGNFFAVLGLNKGFVFALWFSLVLVSPMMISSAFVGKIVQDMNTLEFFKKTFIAGFAEEIVFRGFLFGILFRKLHWGFAPASLVGAIVFGFGHLYQGNSMGETIGIFMVTFTGALWYAWLYIEWNNNLWIPVFLHIFMNVSWTLFDVGENALGDGVTNIFRFITIGLTVFLTLRKNFRQKSFAIHKSNLLINHGTA